MINVGIVVGLVGSGRGCLLGGVSVGCISTCAHVCKMHLPCMHVGLLMQCHISSYHMRKVHMHFYADNTFINIWRSVVSWLQPCTKSSHSSLDVPLRLATRASWIRSGCMSVLPIAKLYSSISIPFFVSDAHIILCRYYKRVCILSICNGIGMFIE